MDLCHPPTFIHYTTNHLPPKTSGSQLPRWRARLCAQARAGPHWFQHTLSEPRHPQNLPTLAKR